MGGRPGAPGRGGQGLARTLERLARDPWARPIAQRKRGRESGFFLSADAVVSAGQNGLFGDADDIVVAVPNAFCPKDKERP